MLTWDTAAFGCIERDSFRVDPATRTAVTTLGQGRFYSATADTRAPLTAHFQTWQTFPQQKAFWQWVHNDLYGGALPFSVQIWLWDRVRFVRAHFIGQLTTRYQEPYDLRLTAGTFEIERESIRPAAQWVEPPPQKDATCLPARASYLVSGKGVHKATCIPTRYEVLVPKELQKAATCIPAKSSFIIEP